MNCICELCEQGAEENGHVENEGEEEEQHEEEGNQEEGVVDEDSTDGAVLVNGSEGDEEWGTDNKGNPSA